MGRKKSRKQTVTKTATNRTKLVDVRYRRLLRDVMAIPLEEASADADSAESTTERDETAAMLSYIFASGR